MVWIIYLVFVIEKIIDQSNFFSLQGALHNHSSDSLDLSYSTKVSFQIRILTRNKFIKFEKTSGYSAHDDNVLLLLNYLFLDCYQEIICLNIAAVLSYYHYTMNYEYFLKEILSSTPSKNFWVIKFFLNYLIWAYS